MAGAECEGDRAIKCQAVLAGVACREARDPAPFSGTPIAPDPPGGQLSL